MSQVFVTHWILSFRGYSILLHFPWSRVRRAILYFEGWILVHILWSLVWVALCKTSFEGWISLLFLWSLSLDYVMYLDYTSKNVVLEMNIGSLFVFSSLSIAPWLTYFWLWWKGVGEYHFPWSPVCEYWCIFCCIESEGPRIPCLGGRISVSLHFLESN